MTPRSLFLPILLLFLLSPIISAQITAQPSVWAGITAHYETEVASPGVDPDYAGFCDCEGRGSRSGRSALFAAAFMARDLFAPDLHLSGRIGFRSATWEFESASYDSLDPGPPVTVSYTYANTMEVRSLSIDLLGSYMLTDGITLSVGPWLDLPFSAHSLQRERIIAPLGRLFPQTGTAQRTIVDGLEPGRERPDVGLTVGASFELEIDQYMSLYPELFIRSDLLSLLRLSAGTSVLLDISSFWRREPPPDQAPALPDSASIVTAQAPSAPPPPSAAIDIYTTDEDGERRQQAILRPASSRHRTISPSPVRFFFDSEHDGIPDRYIVRSRSDARDFSTDSLVKLGPLEIHRHGLDVIGRRLTDAPHAHISIIGFTADDEPPSLSRTRGEAVASYLKDVWRIEQSRITVTDGNGPHRRRGDQSRAVVIESDVREITEPITVEWIRHGYELPPFGVKPTTSSSVGIRRWDITLRWNDSTVGFYSSDRKEASAVTLEVPDRFDEETAPPLIAELRAEDSVGTVAVARDTLPLLVAAPNDTEPDHTETVAAIYNSGSDTKEEDSWASTLEKLLGTLPPDAHITVTPLASSLGLAPINPRTVRTTILEIADRLREAAPSATVLVEEPTSAPTNSALLAPELRMMIDGVRVVVVDR